jgi:hypothetical protein
MEVDRAVQQLVACNGEAKSQAFLSLVATLISDKEIVSKARYQRDVGRVPGSVALLRALGFRKQDDGLAVPVAITSNDVFMK